MTLMVSVFVLDDGTGESHVLDTPEDCSDLAGPEVWRTSVWASEAVRALGARFFPELAEGWLVAQPDEVFALLDECALVRENLVSVARRRNNAGDVPLADAVRSIGDRLTNVEAACHRALAIGGGVLVW
ncbi:hypothetical protein OG599_12125 [Streptomyces sp. NBC_01335]|uniref:hypothetical protein n=1 Tax=Streptomyces sp. NBC_01335 TaxID=2903828 RepID=UPI002E1547CB|nr:hypothetical protein OG599_12125 [Streptomyces sp. NBC_01335]